MGTQASCTFEMTGWNETAYDEIDATAKLTSAKVTQTYRGSIEGEASIDYLMAHTRDGMAQFVGLERLSGVIEGRSGTVVIQHVGSFSDGKARSDWSIVPGAGTGDLAWLRGRGRYVAGHGAPAEVSFEYSFDS